MNAKNKMKLPVDLILLAGLVLFIIYWTIDRFIIKVPDIFSYPWMIISCVLMVIGAYRTGKKLGELFKK